METVFTPLDLIVFFGFLVAAMAVGLIAGRKEDTAEDYFLAGRKLPWWGVAGSIFGSNVSANHMVGMMGIGFSVGFAQSHFELGAIAGLMVLCYGFLPVYRRLKVFTLSQYLEDRYDQRSRACYAVIMVIIMAVVQMSPALYIGARSICFLAGGFALEQAENASVQTPPANNPTSQGEPGAPTTGKKVNVNFTWYVVFVISLAVVAATYTILGGLKAVVWTDVIQSVVLLAAGLFVAALVFKEVGGWQAMMAMDRAEGGLDKMHLYLPMDHAELPWTGVLTGLMAMHFFYWGVNQFIVQRALGARSDQEARLGIVAAGYLKLLIPFFAIAGGVAAGYLFQNRLPDYQVDPDTAFTQAVKLVTPAGFGIIGLISAGLIGAILSSIDSMMNSSATIVTVDIYKRYVNPKASDRAMIFVGRLSIVGFVTLAALLAGLVLDPNSEKNFFLQIADYQNYLTPGLLVVFFMGMFWRRGTATASFVTIIAGVVFSWLVVAAYNQHIGMSPDVYPLAAGKKNLADLKTDELPDELENVSPQKRAEHIDQQRQRLDGRTVIGLRRSEIIKYFGPQLNFFHRVVAVIFACLIVFVVVSLLGRADPKKSRLTWTDLGGHDALVVRRIVMAIAGSLAVFGLLGWLMWAKTISPVAAAVAGAGWMLVVFLGGVVLYPPKRTPGGNPVATVLKEDRIWAAILCSLAVFMLFYFY